MTLLVRCNGEYRAMRYNGQHRLAVLSHLGRKRLMVLTPSARSINADSAFVGPSVSSLPKVVRNGEIIVREAEVDNSALREERNGCTARAGAGNL